MATENSGAPSWPEAPRRDAAAWPEPPQSDIPASWPPADAGRQPTPAWPEPAPREHQAGWPEPARDEVPTAWPQSAPPASQPPQPSWPESSQGGQSGQGGRPGPSGRPDQGGWPEPPVQDPVPAWAEAPAAPGAGAWSNLSSPAPWPQQERAPERPAGYDQPPAHDRTAPGALPPHGRTAYDQHAPPSHDRAGTYDHTSPPLDGRGAGPHGQGAAPLDERTAPRHQAAAPHGPGGQGGGRADEQTMTYIQPPGGRVDEQPSPNGGPPGEPGRPGQNLSRDPSDPDRPFVTAGQISGSRTPPPERQQELWNTVFGDNYQAMGESDSLDDDPGKPIWIYALAGSVAIALVAALLWAFLAGPLAGETPPSTNVAVTKSTPPATPTKKPVNAIGRLPTYRGTAAPVVGTVPNVQAGITVPRLGGTWRLDQRTTVKGTYGFDNRQYAMVGTDTAGQVLTGLLPTRLQSFYTSPDDLEPVIKAVVVDARKRFFEPGNKVRKIAQQPLKVGGATGRLMAYSLTSPTEKATIVAAAINTGRDVPAIVYMSIPSEGKALLPDVNTVVKRLKLAQG